MISISLLGEEEAALAFRNIAHNLQFLEPGLDSLMPGVLDIQKKWWLTGGKGSWAGKSSGGDDGITMHETGRLGKASTIQSSAYGQDVETSRDKLIFGLDIRYAAPLYYRGLSAIAEPTQEDAKSLGDDLLDWILT